MISIIVPVYNSEKYLGRCLTSILEQSYADLEVILVDDASTDSSGAICDAAAQEDLRVKVIHHKANKGLSLSKEDGYRISTGSYISFVDNDDLILPDMYLHLVQQVETEEVAIAGILGRDVESSQIEAVQDAMQKNMDEKAVLVMTGVESCRRIYGRDNKINGVVSATWGKIIRRDFLEEQMDKVRPYKDTLYWVFLEDVLFMPLCYCSAEKVSFLQSEDYLHRRSDGNLSARLSPSEYHYETIAAQDIVMDYFAEHLMQDVRLDMIPGFLMSLQSTWYKVEGYETDAAKRASGITAIDHLWQKYYRELKLCKYATSPEKISSFLFNASRKVWKYTIGFVHFKR